MATRLVFWTGPVHKAAVPQATVPGATEYFYGCLGDKPPLCMNKGIELQSDPSLLLAEAGVEADEIYMGCFSAGGSVVSRLLTNNAYVDKTTCVVTADASYTSAWEDEVNQIPVPITGYLNYALRVVDDPSKLFILTASPNPNVGMTTGKVWASGIRNLQRLRADVETKTGRKFTRLPHFFGVKNPYGVVPEVVHKLGNVIIAEFSGQSNFGHGHFLIQDQIWTMIVNKWLSLGKGFVQDSEQLAVGGGTTKWLLGMATTALAFWGISYVFKRVLPQ